MAFFPNFVLYLKGGQFNTSRLEIVKIDQILDPEINFKIFY